MKEKLRDLMTKEGLKPSQLAEIFGIKPAGISHMLSGRNKPGFDSLQKMLRRFPQINPDWLLLDQGPMYRSDYTSQAPVPGMTAPGVRDAGSKSSIPGAVNTSASAVGSHTKAGAGVPAGLFDEELLHDNFAIGSKANPLPQTPGNAPSQISATGVVQSISAEHVVSSHATTAVVSRIVIFYEDNTFESYFPTRR